MDMKGAIAALDRGLALEAAGKAENMVKTHAIWGGHHTLHAIGATFADEGFVGTKTWAHANGAAPLLILFDSHNGSLRAIIEAFALGQLRTGAISGLATKYLAAEGASDMALIGTGKQAMTQLAAVAAVRPLRRVRAFSRDGAARADFVARARKALGLNVEEASSVAQAVDKAAIVTLVTRATKPILTSNMLAAGGADGRGRPAGADLTLFKAMGMGISDLALGIEILRRASEQRLGREFPHPQPVKLFA